MHHVIGALAIGAIGGRAAGNSEKRRRIVRGLIKGGITAKRKMEAAAFTALAETKKTGGGGASRTRPRRNGAPKLMQATVARKNNLSILSNVPGRQRWRVPSSTTAVLFHEAPHHIGDVSILIHSRAFL